MPRYNNQSLPLLYYLLLFALKQKLCIVCCRVRSARNQKVLNTKKRGVIVPVIPAELLLRSPLAASRLFKTFFSFFGTKHTNCSLRDHGGTRWRSAGVASEPQTVAMDTETGPWTSCIDIVCIWMLLFFLLPAICYPYMSFSVISLPVLTHPSKPFTLLFFKYDGSRSVDAFILKAKLPICCLCVFYFYSCIVFNCAKGEFL